MPYIVKNPRRIPKGVHILRFQPPGVPDGQAQVWYEGDVIETPPEGFNLAWALEKGFLEEVSQGG